MPTKRETDFLVGIKSLHTKSGSKRQIKEKNTQSSAKSLSRKKHIKVSVLSKVFFDRTDTFIFAEKVCFSQIPPINTANIHIAHDSTCFVPAGAFCSVAIVPKAAIAASTFS